MQEFQPGDLVQSLFDKQLGLVLEIEPLDYEEEFGASWVVILWTGTEGITWVSRNCIKLINRTENKIKFRP